MSDVKEGKFTPTIIKKSGEPIEFSAIELKEYSDFDTYQIQQKESLSEILEDFFADKEIYTRIRQKSVDLRRIVSSSLERDHKKLQLQQIFH